MPSPFMHIRDERVIITREAFNVAKTIIASGLPSSPANQTRRHQEQALDRLSFQARYPALISGQDAGTC